MAISGQNGGDARVFCDVGADGRCALGQYAYDCLLDKRTWETPAIRPTGAPLPQRAEALAGTDIYLGDGLRIAVRQTDVQGAAAYTARVTNLRDSARRINGLSFTVPLGEGAAADFPLNTPHGVIDGDSLAPLQAVQGGLTSSAIHVSRPQGDINILFLDTVEKWSLGVYRATGGLRAVFIAAVECDLPPGGALECGTLYLQTPAGDPYIAIRDFFAGLGYAPAAGGHQGGVMYSCHPNGAMDGGMDSEPQGPGLVTFAEYLPALRDMGVDHIWLLPVFEHAGRGVYHPSDQRVIDRRYGGDDAVRHYVGEAHRLGMTVLFDYVPHGPAPGDPLALAHPQWLSLRPDGTPQEEWDCVSFDMTLPAYRAYTADLVREHVARFDIDGARIDCAMGGLSNWRPQAGRRPSASNLSGGVDITRAIFEGFRASGKKTLVLPENFNPVPVYYPVTDVFYGMNFYRLLVELDERYRLDPPAYVRALTRWLEIEHKTLPEGLGRLRFLGNHDTVSWVWQKSRAADWYGVERAKALFALIFLIDGLPMLYMGDEDPALARKEGPVLRGFFTDLIALRKATVGDSAHIEHLYTGGSVFACARENAGRRYLVAINLGDTRARVTLCGQDFALPAFGWKVAKL